MGILERGHRKPDNYLGDDYYQGYLGNLRVTLFDYKLTIKGSLSLYAMGNQLEAMNLIDARQAIVNLSAILRLPIEKAEVKRLDITANIQTNFKPATYYNYLGKAGRYKRLEQDNGLYYRKGKSKLLIYDKLREMRNKKKPVPEDYVGRNILRYEFSFKKDLCEQFNMPSITAGTLLEEPFYEAARESWAAAYFSIQKEREAGQLLQAVSNVKSFVKFLAFKGVKALGGFYKLHQIITQGLLEKIWDRQVSNSLSKKLNEIAEDTQVTTTSPLIEELDQKISEAKQADYYQTKRNLPKI